MELLIKFKGYTDIPVHKNYLVQGEITINDFVLHALIVLCLEMRHLEKAYFPWNEPQRLD